MNEKKSYFVGNARLSELNGFEDTQKNGVRGCFIPYDINPSLFIGRNAQSGATTVDLDILVRETRNSKSGSSHFIKLSVGKANREKFKLAPEAIDSLKIIGNLFTRVPGQNIQQQNPQNGFAPSGQSRQQRPSGGQFQQGFHQREFQEDMPDFSGRQNQQAGW